MTIINVLSQERQRSRRIQDDHKALIAELERQDEADVRPGWAGMEVMPDGELRAKAEVR